MRHSSERYSPKKARDKKKHGKDDHASKGREGRHQRQQIAGKSVRESLGKSRPLAEGQFVIMRILEILTDTGNKELSALGEAQNKQVFIARIPETINVGDAVVVKLQSKKHKLWYGDFIRVHQEPQRMMGVYERSTKLIRPIHYKRDFIPLPPATPLEHMDVVLFEEKNSLADIKEIIGKFDEPRVFSKIAAYANDVWYPITREEELACKSYVVPSLDAREDFRTIDLVTIDGKDARDFDDAVWACPDTDPKNPGGFRIVVAIADVAYYVREGDVIDLQARTRGNSVYFPDFVLPMLPEGLSNDLCSLRPNVDRACVIADMIISNQGKLKSAHFKRALMCSKARLTYDEVEKALNGKVSENIEPVMASTITPLYHAYRLLRNARDERGSLNIKSTEHEIIFDKERKIKEVAVREQLVAHQIIEEMMILANVAVARALKNRDWPSMYRVHSSPDAMKVETLKVFSKILELPKLKSAIPTPHEFNKLLESVEGSPYESLINDLVLRSQAQARYSPHNEGHFGLGLQDYSHFTSPIRRYSDLITHRILIDKFKLGEGGYAYETLDVIAEHISWTERKAASAEREARERYLAAYLASQVGENFDATIVGVNQSGLFIELRRVHAQAFIPKRFLFDAFPKARSSYFDASYHILRIGKESFQLGMPLRVTLVEANPVTSQVTCALMMEKGPLNDKKHDKSKEKNKKKRKKR